MLKLVSLDNISEQVWDSVESRYHEMMELSPWRRRKIGLVRKILYLCYLTTLPLSDLATPPYPILTKEKRVQIKHDFLDIVKITMQVGGRGKTRRKIECKMPVFLDFHVEKDGIQTFFEEEMWKAVTDSWAYDTIKLDFSGLGGAKEIADKMLRATSGMKLKVHAPPDRIVEHGLRYGQLAELRTYDLLVNKRDYGMSTDALFRLVPRRSMGWFCGSPLYKKVFGGTDGVELMKSY